MVVRRLKKAQPPAQNGVANPSASVADIVSGVIEAVRQRGDGAVRDYALKFDKMEPKKLSVSPADLGSKCKEANLSLLCLATIETGM